EGPAPLQTPILIQAPHRCHEEMNPQPNLSDKESVRHQEPSHSVRRGNAGWASGAVKTTKRAAEETKKLPSNGG
ncbi:hypothetical protein FRC01_013747, partial [Tulasnella sp. 417]